MQLFLNRFVCRDFGLGLGLYCTVVSKLINKLNNKLFQKCFNVDAPLAASSLLPSICFIMNDAILFHLLGVSNQMFHDLCPLGRRSSWICLLGQIVFCVSLGRSQSGCVSCGRRLICELPEMLVWSIKNNQIKYTVVVIKCSESCSLLLTVRHLLRRNLWVEHDVSHGRKRKRNHTEKIQHFKHIATAIETIGAS